jgi:hypothetical protein
MADTFQDYLAMAQASFPDVPRVVIEAVAAIESGFNPRAYLEEKDGDGSIGLMQIRLSTSKTLGYSAGKDDLYHPGTNLYYGTKLLNGIARQIPRGVGGRSRWERVVSAYNGGYRANLGFGTPVEKETTVCLRRDPQTGFCIKQFTAKPGEFGNEGHVQRFIKAVRDLGGGLPDLPSAEDTEPG